MTEGRGLSVRLNILSAAETSSWAEPQECAMVACHQPNSGINKAEGDVKRHPEDPSIRFSTLGLTPVEIGHGWSCTALRDGQKAIMQAPLAVRS